MRRRILLGGEEEGQYLTIVSLANNNTIGWKVNSSSTSLKRTISVSTDNGSTWTSKTSSATGTQLAVLNNGEQLLIKGSNSNYTTSSSYYIYFTSTANFNVEGNIMSLIYGDNFNRQTTLSSTYTFTYLFRDCTSLISAENLILPATTLASSCYYGMFYGCTSLTTAPELPATVLANLCYYRMFQGCISLTVAPELPATTLAASCYSYMFYNCSSLNYIKCLATNRSASNCTSTWVSGVSATGTFVKNSAMSSWPSGNNGIPSGWTV